jgi:thiamine kinase-like enzyme
MAHRDLQPVFQSLVDRTASTKVCLVHGDVSPKNILVGSEGPTHFPVFLDAECAWYGDPAFDLAFCLNHLLLKCLWVPAARNAFLACFAALSGTYLENVSFENIESRTASLLPALLLARVDGKSPVEYLGDSQKALVRKVARELIGAEASLQKIRETWQRSST